MNEELSNYISTLIEDTELMMDEYQNPEMAFTAAVLEKIETLIDCQEIIKEHCKILMQNGNVKGEIHGYGESTNKEVLYLFYTFYNPQPTVESKSNTDSQFTLKRMQGFYNSAIRAGYLDLDESSSEYRASKFIYENAYNYKSVNLIVISNYIINNLTLQSYKIANKPIYCDIWDLKKIYGNTHSLSDHISIDIDFDSDEYSRYKIPYIQMESTQYGYKCIQAMFPAKLIYQLYERYNTNLLYNNVRYFLGLKGAKEKKPNVAMLDTLRKNNEMFLAYNNGITALAKNIDSELVGDRTDITDHNESSHYTQYISMGVLKKISDFRIINGGQTTAVIYNAKVLSDSTKDESKKVNLLGVYVQVKLIISDDIEKISGNITLSSNFQNQTKYSDFSVGNQFNIKMEELSHNIIVPNKNNEPTYWFYERLRGQYDEKKKLHNTKADRDYFEFQYPKKRKFSKEDIAKVWCNWEQSPFDAVKGASTTYATFMKKIVDRNFVPDDLYYKQSIGLLIIYKFLMARPEGKEYANGKATVAAYAMSMLSYLTLGKFNLLKVWEDQAVSDNAKIFLNTLCDKIFHILKNKAEEANTTMLSYGKTKGAYDYIKSNRFDIDLHLLDEYKN